MTKTEGFFVATVLVLAVVSALWQGWKLQRWFATNRPAKTERPEEAMTTTADVTATLTEIRDLLSSHRVQWASIVESTLMSIAESDRGDVKDRVLALFGGMGSLNDVFISRRNGHLVDDEKAANAQLDRLASQLWNQAKAL